MARTKKYANVPSSVDNPDIYLSQQITWDNLQLNI